MGQKLMKFALFSYNLMGSLCDASRIWIFHLHTFIGGGDGGKQ